MKRDYEPITFLPIGVIHSPFIVPKGTPLQATNAIGIEAKVEIFPEFEDGLVDIEEFSHIILIYQFHMAKPPKMRVVPYLDSQPHGVFATRSPSRPNPIGFSVVRLVSREATFLTIDGCDILDQTPLIDIKPFVPGFDLGVHDIEAVRIGWLTRAMIGLKNTSDDGRFTAK